MNPDNNFKTEIEEASEELFISYYEQNIIPLVEENNRIKDMFRSKFWAFLWGGCFLYGLCVLIVLFRYLIYGYKIDGEYIFFITLLALGSVCWPLYCYSKAQKNNLFEAILKYYRNWQINTDRNAEICKTDIVPLHDNCSVLQSLTGWHEDNKIDMSEVAFSKNIKLYKWQFEKQVSKGILIDIKFNQKINNDLYLFDKAGFYKKNTYSDLPNISKVIMVPAANYFRIFCADEEFAKDMLPLVFFERILDMKYVFGAKAIYLEMRENFVRIYLEGAYLYFNCDGLWNKFVDQKEFVSLNKKINQILLVTHIVNTLRNSQ